MSWTKRLKHFGLTTCQLSESIAWSVLCNAGHSSEVTCDVIREAWQMVCWEAVTVAAALFVPFDES